MQPAEMFLKVWNLHTLQEKHGPLALVQIDAHPDISDNVFGEKLTNSTPFRRAVEEGLLDCERVVQIGLRGATKTPHDYDFGKSEVLYNLIITCGKSRPSLTNLWNGPPSVV